jgi:colanic acid/amylovoran biosynthesis protein
MRTKQKGNRLNIVVVNSHADNRGDEAAHRSMIFTLSKLSPNAKFTVVTNSPDGLDLGSDVKVLRFVALSKTPPYFSLPFVIIWFLFKLFRLELASIFKKFEIFSVLKNISNANIVFSAPGGPYFGDKYKRDEFSEHFLLIAIAKLFCKPLMIYGPSMGPFNISIRNRLRRFFLNKAEILTIRDPISKTYLDLLHLSKPLIQVTSDSAFQYDVKIQKNKLDEILKTENIISRNLIDSKTMAKLIDYIIEALNATVVFFPQLYGRSDDLSLINSIIQLTKNKDYIRTLSKQYNSDIQQAVISRMDIVIANRYHSMIFALKSAIPTLCIAYEHKSSGIMQTVGLDKFIIFPQNFEYKDSIHKINILWKERLEIKEHLIPWIDRLKNMSLSNSFLAQALINCYYQDSISKKNIEKEYQAISTSYHLKKSFESIEE